MFKLLGALGLILVSLGVLIKKERTQNWYFIAGGLLLEIYSIYIHDPIFMILQIIFILAPIYELITKK